MSNPFFIAGRIQNPDDFVGRKAEISRIFSALETGYTGQAQHFNIVAPRRMGKSSLLYYLTRTYSQNIPHAQAYRVIYVDLDHPRCHTRSALLSHILEQLGIEHPLPLKLEEFYDSIAEQRERPDAIWPVVCVDEFEHLIKRKDEFPDSFYDTWRSLGNNNLLSIIVASQSPLNQLARQEKLTSPFFNIFTLMRLGEFTPQAAQQLIARGNFSPEEAERVLDLGGRHPYKLQLAAKLLYAAKADSQPVDWGGIKKDFRQQAAYIFDDPAQTHWTRRWSRKLCRWAAAAFRTVGRLILVIFNRNEHADDNAAVWAGVVTVVIILAVLLGWLNLDMLKNTWRFIFPLE
ncbi:MAG: AAA family ATPase [Chloroflexota bacterium]|nr:AAA family ATPase [Chloroflexota bacterium]